MAPPPFKVQAALSGLMLSQQSGQTLGGVSFIFRQLKKKSENLRLKAFLELIKLHICAREIKGQGCEFQRDRQSLGSGLCGEEKPFPASLLSSFVPMISGSSVLPGRHILPSMAARWQLHSELVSSSERGSAALFLSAHMSR